MSQVLEPRLFCNSQHGVYIPQLSVQEIIDSSLGNIADISQETIQDILSGPYSEYYWESWDTFLDKFEVEENGETHRLDYLGDCDLWLVPDGYEYPEEY